MPDPVVASTRLFSGSPARVLLDLYASFGYCRNATTAKGSTSAGHTVEVSFDVVDPPAISEWFVAFPDLKEFDTKRRLQILSVAGVFVLFRMSFTDNDGRRIEYFVYKAGPGRPSVDLIPGPCPKVAHACQIGILHSAAGEHYSVVFPTPHFRLRVKYEIHVFSSESQGWSTKVARITADRETTYQELVRHAPSKAIPVGESSLGWIDMFRGVLLCNVLDEDPVLRLLQWPVLPPHDDSIDIFTVIEIFSGQSIRDATLSNGVIRFVQSFFDDSGGVRRGWMATMWKRETSSEYWYRCCEADIEKILATSSSFSHLIRKKLWDDETGKLDLNKLYSAPPKLSLQHEDVVYFKAMLKSGDPEALLLAVNLREERLEAVELVSDKLAFFPCIFSSDVTIISSQQNTSSVPENSSEEANKFSIRFGSFDNFVWQVEKEREEIAGTGVMPHDFIFQGANLRKKQQDKKPFPANSSEETNKFSIQFGSFDNSVWQVEEERERR
ncbi:hypothetical protein ACP70R_012546 [Stipagrostis hirtigluma subsp. patula]